MDMTELAERISDGRLFHSYIITGGNDSLRQSAGKLIARAAVCSGTDHIPCGVCRDCKKAERDLHPDINFISRTNDEKEIKVDRMRDVRAKAYVLPNEASRSVFIINDADTMNTQAQNAMLKVFEEPPSYAVFVLLAENSERLLPTVRSRCEIINLAPVGDQHDEDVSDVSKSIISAIISGNNARIMKAVTPLEKSDRAQLSEIFMSLRRFALSNALSGNISSDVLDKISNALDKAEKYMSVNVSSGHITGMLLAELIQTRK